jgi:hypothetical protein
VSTQDQNLTGQIESLKAAGATTIYREKVSGVRARTGEGRRRAQAAGVKFGRKPKLSAFQRAEAVKRRAVDAPAHREYRRWRAEVRSDSESAFRDARGMCD